MENLTKPCLGPSCQKCRFTSCCLAQSIMEKTQINQPLFELKPGENLAQIDQPLTKLYVVKTGSIKHATLSQEGNEQVADFYFAGDIIGLEKLHFQGCSCYLTALEPTQICIIDLNKMEHSVESRAWLQQRLMKLLSQKLAARTQALLIQHQHAEQKLAAFLLDLSHRLKKIGHTYTSGYHLSMSRQEIGNYLHLSTETVSRLFSKFQIERLIDVQKKHVVLKDVNRLSAKIL